MSGERLRRIHEFRVGRILAVLDDENLTTNAALNLKSGEGLRFECNFAESVWDDPRIVRRVQQLASRGITVTIVDHQHEVAGKTFARSQILVQF